MTRWPFFAPLVVLGALAVLFAAFALKHDPHVQPHALVGKPLPDVSLPILGGVEPRSLRAAAARGPFLVNVFASWCAPCELEAPVLNGLRARGVRMIGVAYKDAPEKTQGFLGRLGDPFEQSLVDRAGRAGIELGVTGVPETYLVDGAGVIRAKHTGPLTEADAKDLESQLAKLAR